MLEVICMKKQVILTLLTVISLRTVGQDKVLTADSDTVFWYSRHISIRNRIGLKETKTIHSEFYFRFWDGKRIIELRQGNKKLNGTVTFVLKEYKRNKEGEIHFKRNKLTEKTTEEISELLSKYGIINLPTDNLIEGWSNGFDGRTFITEYADKSSYSFKTYWTPSAFKDKLKEAKQLADFIDKLDSIEELQKLEKSFMDRQPFSTWYSFIGSGTKVAKIN